jgi:hypothetical protein
MNAELGLIFWGAAFPSVAIDAPKAELLVDLVGT